MTKIAFCFPGQGSLEAGMGREIAEAVPEAMEVYERAARRRASTSRSCASRAPIEELVETEVQQPALVATSLAMLAALTARGIKPDFVDRPLGRRVRRAGRGRRRCAVDEAIALVRERGLAMAEAARKQPGSMAAILGLADEVVEAALRADRERVARELQLPGPDRRLRRERRPSTQRCVEAAGGGRARDGQAQGLRRVPQPARRDGGRAAAPGARARPLHGPDRAVHVHGDRAGRAGAAARRPARRPADGAGALHAGGDAS